MAIGDSFFSQTGMTPTAMRKLDGPVPGMTWDQFVQQMGGGQQNAVGGATANVNGLGSVYSALEGGNFSNGEGNGFGTPTTGASYYQDVGDGTRNLFSRGPNGELVSKNMTQNDDGWLSKALDVIAPIAISGVGLYTGLGAAGMLGGAGGVGGAAAGAGAGAGAAGEGLAAGATGAFDLGGTVGGAAGAGGYDAGLAGAFGLNPGVIGTAGATGSSYYPTMADASGDLMNVGAQSGGGYGAAGEGMAAGDTGAFDMGGTFGGSQGAGGLSTGLVNGYTGSGGSSILSQLGKAGGSTNPFSAISNILNGTGGAGDYWSLASGVGVPLLNGILGSNAASNAAKTQANAANQSNALLAQIYGDNVARNQPYVTAGNNALGLMTNPAAAKAAFQTDPGYDFAFGQGQRAVQSSAAARGGLYSGRAAKDLTTYGQGVADQQYGNWYGRQANLAQMGQASANNTAMLGQNFGSAYGNNLTSGASATAAGQIGSTNAWTGALSSMLGSYQQNQLLQQLLGQRAANGYYGG